MKIKITINQLKEVLKTEPAKYPIEIMMKNVDQSELLRIGNILNQNKK